MIVEGDMQIAVLSSSEEVQKHIAKQVKESAIGVKIDNYKSVDEVFERIEEIIESKIFCIDFNASNTDPQEGTAKDIVECFANGMLIVILGETFKNKEELHIFPERYRDNIEIIAEASIDAEVLKKFYQKAEEIIEENKKII